MHLLRSSLLMASVAALAACESLSPTPHPDYTIHVVQTPSGKAAVQPKCPSWATENANPFDNQPIPQFGCANARNLAGMIENPNDLVEGRDLAPTRGVTLVGSVRRYDNNQTRGLILPGPEINQNATSTAAQASSSMTGDATGGASTGGTPAAAP